MRIMISLLMVAACWSPVAAFAEGTESFPGDASMAVGMKEFKMLTDLCESCHGQAGATARDDVPSLAGRPATEILAEMERFYFYERHCPDVPVDQSDAGKGNMSMCDVTNQMNKAEAMALARYFEDGSLPAPPPPTTP